MKRPAKTPRRNGFIQLIMGNPFLRLLNILVARLFLNEYLTTCGSDSHETYNRRIAYY
jgi:hypothetical protein